MYLLFSLGVQGGPLAPDVAIRLSRMMQQEQGACGQWVRTHQNGPYSLTTPRFLTTYAR